MTPPATPPPQQTTQQPANPEGQPGPKPTDERKTTENAAPARPAAPSGANAPVDSNAYKVGPADVLTVRVWNEAEFSGPVSVQQNGNITLPLIGDLHAGGMTPVEIQDVIAKALAKYVVKPLVTVTVQEVGSKKYYVDGQVARAGEYPLVVPTTVLEAISKAGGPQEFANTKKIYVLRGSTRIPFNYKNVLRGKNMNQNINLQSSDHVVVP